MVNNKPSKLFQQSYLSRRLSQLQPTTPISSQAPHPRSTTSQSPTNKSHPHRHSHHDREQNFRRPPSKDRRGGRRPRRKSAPIPPRRSFLRREDEVKRLTGPSRNSMILYKPSREEVLYIPAILLSCADRWIDRKRSASNRLGN